jgi:hypothetical protein
MSTVPWTANDRRLLAVRLGAGAAVVTLAWFIASGENEPADQLPLAALSVLGGLLGMYGVFAWVARGRRLVGERARFLLGVAPGSGAGTHVDVASAETLVAGGEHSWFHRADCLLAVSRHWPTADRSVHEQSGRRPCPACKP